MALSTSEAKAGADRVYSWLNISGKKRFVFFCLFAIDLLIRPKFRLKNGVTSSRSSTRGNVSTKTLTIAVRLLLIKPEDTGQSVITRSDWWV